MVSSTVRYATAASGLILLTLGGCTGDIGPATEADPPGGTPTRSDEPPSTNADLAPARARRLAIAEIRNTVADMLFAGALGRVPPLPPPTNDGFDNDTALLGMDIGFVETMSVFAEATANEVLKDLTRLAPCDDLRMVSGCGSRFIATHAPRLYRRPIEPAESQRLLVLFNAALGSGTYEQAVASLIQMMLLSPQFLYRTELGSLRDAAGVVTLTSYERASALSYGLWRTGPDAQLLAAAQTAALDGETGLRTQVLRMLDDPRARPALRSFVVQWLQLHPMDVSKSDPVYTGSLARAMQVESERFVDEALWGTNAGLGALLTSTRSFVNGELARLYGLDVSSTTPVAVSVPVEQQRGGVMGLPAFVASHTPRDAFSPIELAVIVRVQMLCATLPTPPADVPDPSTNARMSTRQRFDRHRADPACAGCHTLLDPVGFAFERFGTTGQYRLIEQPSGAMLTGEGRLTATDVDGPIVGPAQLGQRLAESKQARSCAAAQTLRYLLGRPTSVPSQRTTADERTLTAVTETTFAGGDFKKLMAALVLSDSFLRRDGSRLPN